MNSPSSKKTGRPRKLTQSVQDALCDAVRNGATLSEAGQQVGVSDDTIRRERGPSLSFADTIKKAMEERAELWSEECVYETEQLLKTGNCTHEQINYQRLRNGVRMWRCRVDNPARFGGKPQAPVQVGIDLRLTEEQRLQMLERRERAGRRNESTPNNPETKV